MKTRRLLLFLLITLCTYLSLDASHLIGGHMSYTCSDTSNGMVRLDLFLDMIRGSNESWSTSLDNSREIGIYRQNVDGDWEYHSYARFNLRETEVLPVQIDEYQYFPYNLEYELGHYSTRVSLPIDEGPYLIAYQRCCRIEEDFTNIINHDSLGSAVTLLITEESLQNCNSSPKVAFNGNRIFYKDSLSIKDFMISDADGDQLLVSFSSPRVAGGLAGSFDQAGNASDCNGVTPDPVQCLPPFDEVVYADGYSGEQPFGIGNTEFILDSDSFMLTGIPREEGLFMIGLKIQEYRNGKLLSESYYDYAIEILPVSEIAKIKTRTFYDLNLNGIRDGNENYFNVPLTITNGYLYSHSESTSEDSYLCWAVGQVKSYSLVVFNKPQWRVNSPNDTITIDVEALRESYYIDIPVVPVIEGVLADTYIGSQRLICNETVTYKITVVNYGTKRISGMCTLTFDDLLTIDTTIIDYEQITPNQISWEFPRIYAGRDQTFLFHMQMPDESFINELIDMKIETEVYESGGSNSESVTYETDYSSILLCSYDPNDKLAHPESPFGRIGPNDELFYTIRFQNTGNLWAKDVVIADTLSPQLDLSTFKVLSASHYYRLEKQDNAIAFKFLDIFLPDSTNHPQESQGYVTFKIKPKPGLANNTLIQNQAYIYFDRNAPIITNTVSRRIGRGKADDLHFALYPNPFSQQLTLELDDIPRERLKLEIYDALGRRMSIQTLNDRITPLAIDQIGQGLYYLRISNAEGKTIGSQSAIKYQ